jgi:hypothetical protein
MFSRVILPLPLGIESSQVPDTYSTMASGIVYADFTATPPAAVAVCVISALVALVGSAALLLVFKRQNLVDDYVKQHAPGAPGRTLRELLLGTDIASVLDANALLHYIDHTRAATASNGLDVPAHVVAPADASRPDARGGLATMRRSPMEPALQAPVSALSSDFL